MGRALELIHINIHIYMHKFLCICIFISIYIYIYISLRKNKTGHIRIINLFPQERRLGGEIQWSILKRSITPKCFDSRCNLCLEEKILIMIYQDPEKLLNKRSE